ncbi:hypothetical protein, partial [Burkholderia gladioli]|uniref:hypothetical protein n=1 Tax=Burkholderia gladioli TaxID=28095 RepID=UPI001ABA992E
RVEVPLTPRVSTRDGFSNLSGCRVRSYGGNSNSFAAPLTSAPIELSLDILLIKSIKKTFKSPSTQFITLFNI